MEIKKGDPKKILTSHDLRPVKPRDLDRKPSETISTADIDSAKLRRDRIISLATEEELDEFARKIAPRIEQEETIVVFRCSNSSCQFRGRNRRKKVGDPCPICAKRNYEFEGEKFEAGVLVELVGKELVEFYEEEKKTNDRLLQQAHERQEAQNVLFRAGVMFRRDR